jgi:hypothetical protein
MAGDTVLSEISVYSRLAVNTPVTVSLENIPVSAEAITVIIYGDIASKGMAIDDVSLIRTGDLPAVNYIKNPSFEADAAAITGDMITDWVATDSWGTGTLSKTEAGGYDGNYALSRWYSEPYTATNTQTLTDLPSGIYTLTAWAMSKAAESGKPYLITTISIQVNGQEIGTVQVAADQSWKQYGISNIEIKDTDTVTVIIDTNDTVGGGWTKIDLIELNKVSEL